MKKSYIKANPNNIRGPYKHPYQNLSSPELSFAKPTKLAIICEPEKDKLINYSFKKPKLNNRLFRKRHLQHLEHRPVIKSRFLRRNYNVLKRSITNHNNPNHVEVTELDLNDS